MSTKGISLTQILYYRNTAWLEPKQWVELDGMSTKRNHRFIRTYKSFETSPDTAHPPLFN
jgi:hypothetical protein